jgi:anthranilate phosphoribosyltransferase
MRDEGIGELVSLVRGLREAMPRVDTNGPVLDTTGTGGDGFKTINISTLVAVVAAAAGVQVAKQNRHAISSYCGSTDFLAELGVAYDLPPDAAADCLRQTGICFLYSPLYHRGVAHTGVGPPPAMTVPRPGADAERTMSDLLLPLANPAGAQHFLLGVADGELASKVAQILVQLGAGHSLVIHGDDGMDEITCTKTTTVHEVKDGQVRTWTLDPTTYGYLRAPRHALLGGDAVENVLISRNVLGGRGSLYRQYVEVNSAAALYAADRVASIEEGIALAKETIDSGAARQRLEQVIQVSQDLKKSAELPSSSGRA